MKSKLTAFGLMMILAGMLTACLGSDDDDNEELYKDSAITSLSLGTMKRTVHTTSSTGEDSTYTVSVTGSDYRMTIDQQTREIYNTDSLPYATNVSRVILTIATRNSGVAVLNLRTYDGLKDSLVNYSSNDSVDVSKPLEIRVYNQAGTAYRSYTLKVGVKQQETNVKVWTVTTLTEQERADLLAQRPVVPAIVEEIIGSSALDASAEWLPTAELNLCTMTLKTNADMTRTVLLGNRSVELFPADTTAVVWSRINGGSEADAQPWMFYNPAPDNHSQLPRMANLQVVVYGDRLLAIGGKGVGACTQDAYLTIYESVDYGLTWQASSDIVLPNGISTDESYCMLVDNEQQLWIIGTMSAWKLK